MNPFNQKFGLALAVASCVMFTACSSEQGEAPVAPATTKTVEPAPITNQPLTRDQVEVLIEQVGQATYSPADDNLHVKVKLTNNGTAALPSGGSNPVQLGIIQIDPTQEDSTKRRGKDSRAALLADLQPNDSIDVDATIPGSFAEGYKLQFEPLQEGVAWFGFNYEQPVLIVGPFVRCADSKALCDAAGAMIAVE